MEFETEKDENNGLTLVELEERLEMAALIATGAEEVSGDANVRCSCSA